MTGDVLVSREAHAREVAHQNNVSDAQFNFLIRLVRERAIIRWGTSPDERVATAYRLLIAGQIDRAEASRLIDLYLTYDLARTQVVDAKLTTGVYELDGAVYVVKSNKQKDRLYAKKLVESVDRLNEEGDVVEFDFVYAPGVIYQLRPEHRMPLERAKKLMIRYGKCINCNRRLKAATSVERGIGPVCVKAFG